MLWRNIAFGFVRHLVCNPVVARRHRVDSTDRENMKNRIITAIAASAALLAGAADASTLVFAEDFEGTQISKRWRVFDTFGQFVTTDGAGIEIQRDGTVVNTPNGKQYVELDSHKGNGGNVNASTSNTSMAAIANLVAGAQHTLTFLYQPRTNRANDNGIAVSVGSLDTSGASPVFTQSLDLGSVDGQRRTYGGWTLITMSFRAGITDNAVMFRAFGIENTLGGFLDDVKVHADLDNIQQTPLPAGGILLGTGLIALARRNRRG